MNPQIFLSLASSVAFSGTLLFLPIGSLFSASLILSSMDQTAFPFGVSWALHLATLYVFHVSCMCWYYVWRVSGWDGIDRAIALGLSSIRSRGPPTRRPPEHVR